MSIIDTLHIHVSYLVAGLVLAVGSYVGVHSFLQEHDARLLAQQQQKISEAVVKGLQQQIADRDAAAAKQQQVIVKVIHDTTTPQQAAQVLPQIVTAPLPVPVVVQAAGSWLIPEPDVLPIFQQLADQKICRSELTTVQGDLTDTKAIVVQKDAEITTLKKPKGFWRRVGGTMKSVGIGIGVGLTLARVL
jgi:hypothetical protein